MIKLGIVGTGGISHWHAKEFGKIKGVEIAAACDINEKVIFAFFMIFTMLSAALSPVFAVFTFLFGFGILYLVYQSE